MTSPDVWDRLAVVNEDISIRHRELGELIAAETEGRVRAFESSHESTVTGRDRYASLLVLDLTVDIIKIKGEIRALENEQKYLLARVESGT